MKDPAITATVVDEQIVSAAKQAGGIFRSRFGLWLLGMISFVESALVVPLVTDPFLVAYILANKQRALAGTVVTVASSVLGGAVAYATAVALFEFVSYRFLTTEQLLEFYLIAEGFNEGAFVLTFLGAVTPIPYTLVALAAGFVKASFVAFVVASIVGRGFRYGLVGYLTYRYGDQALERARRNVTAATVVLIVLGSVYLFFKLS